MISIHSLCLKGATLTIHALAKHFPQLIATETDTVLGTIDKLEGLKTTDIHSRCGNMILQ